MALALMGVVAQSAVPEKSPEPSPIAQAAPRVGAVDRQPDGLFYIDADVGAGHVRLLIDTGATVLTLFRPDAERLGLLPRDRVFRASVLTPGGLAPAAIVHVPTLEIAGHVFHNVDALVINQRIGVSLLGQNVMRELGPIRIDGDRLFIEPDEPE